MSVTHIHHLGLAVKNLDDTTAFFERLGFDTLLEKPDYPARFIGNGSTVLTLWQVEAGAAAFDRRQHIGLHHFALEVESEDALNTLFRKVQDVPGVDIDFAPEPAGPGGALHAMLFEPGGIRIELFWPGSAA